MTKSSTKNLVLASILTAIVIILQFLGSFIKLGHFSVSAVLVPIVIGVATCGVGVGAWLGFVFGIVVILSGDATPFLAINVPGTIITVLLKGTLCGLFAGIVYKIVAKLNKYAAVAAAAVICPIVNTGIFLLGCLAFFMDTISGWALELGFGGNVAQYMIFVLVGANFLAEMAVNVLLSPAIVRLLNINEK